jgi:O-antigen/teichoic acid export membrane protein
MYKALILRELTFLHLSDIKKLAGQTLWYGVPTILTRFLSYAIALLAYRYPPELTGDYTLIYAIIPFLNILYTYGLETSYFRFANLENKQHVYNTLSVSILASTVLFSVLLYSAHSGIISFFNLKDHPEYVTWMIAILFFDMLAVLPFCKLREEGRPKKFAAIKVVNIIINVLLVLFFTVFCERIYKKDPGNFFIGWYNPDLKVGYFIIANLIASIITLLLLYRELMVIRFRFNRPLWTKVMRYSMPLIIVGFGGMVNEMLSRVLFEKFAHLPELESKKQLGIFGANFKLAVLITIFIQVFKMAAEPFFFKKAGDADAKKTYARVMKFFVIACCFMFLFVVLFLHAWKLLISYKHTEYAEGIGVVPVLALGYIFLGIYYNLSVWYKLTDKNMFGAYITVMGVVITVLLNYLLVPKFGYLGSAWATFFCYLYMMVVSYIQGQKHYKIPYATRKLIAYIVLCILLFLLHEVICRILPGRLMYFGLSFFFLAFFSWFIIQIERKELVKIPYLNKLIKPVK